jgi:hypothetical protein
VIPGEIQADSSPEEISLAGSEADMTNLGFSTGKKWDFFSLTIGTD